MYSQMGLKINQKILHLKPYSSRAGTQTRDKIMVSKFTTNGNISKDELKEYF